MLRRLLIANRGEIVCRIARTARRLGVTSIAVYSDADRGARHVRSCDEALHLGGSAPAASYLDIGKLIETAQRAGADALHPGYGFLSENAALASACTAAGLVFVGPPAGAIIAMGSKSASKAAMAAVGVPVAPGYHGDEQTAERLLLEARRVGFPLIIKASAGGGGKGMRVLQADADVAAAVESARRVARAAFGDDRLLLERYFARARHVEVQVFADAHGEIVSLFDRDCSVQRRHQKIIEEAPAPGLRDEVRSAMSRAAILAARAVGYVGAGTVEFLVDEAQDFYFMEMNTRLQVEHPVTEFITGTDLVEWQLRIAQGERLPLRQDEIVQRGCAIEARVYAEDPAQDYLPSVGRIEHLVWPTATEGVRLDVGFDSGDDVSPYYDPMLGKIIAWNDSRAAALASLRQSLRTLEIAGVASNRALLISILGDAEFRRGAVATNFLEMRHGQLAFGEPAPGDDDLALAAIWCASRRSEPGALWQDTRGWRLSLPPLSSWNLAGRAVDVEVIAQDEYLARVGETELRARVMTRDERRLHAEVGGRIVRMRMFSLADQLHVFRDGRQLQLLLRSTEHSLEVDAAVEQGSLLTPLPGTIVAVHVAAGQTVARFAPLITVEAMKMEHTLTAPYAGTVSRIAYAVGDRVAGGAVLVDLTPADSG